jgi:hypothetical protein
MIERHFLDQVALREHYDRETIRKLEAERKDLKCERAILYADLSAAWDFLYSKNLREEFLLHRAKRIRERETKYE